MKFKEKMMEEIFLNLEQIEEVPVDFEVLNKSEEFKSRADDFNFYEYCFNNENEYSELNFEHDDF